MNEAATITFDAHSLTNHNPNFYNTSDPDGNDGKFMTSDDGLRLSSSSPCVDKGDNSYISFETDIAGNTREIDGDNNQIVTVDMGAYEYEPD